MRTSIFFLNLSFMSQVKFAHDFPHTYTLWVPSQCLGNVLPHFISYIKFKASDETNYSFLRLWILFCFLVYRSNNCLFFYKCFINDSISLYLLISMIWYHCIIYIFKISHKQCSVFEIIFGRIVAEGICICVYMYFVLNFVHIIQNAMKRN